jgi:hypothetical protein
MDLNPSKEAHVAVDDLLATIAQAAKDLNAFHAAVSQAPINPLPPFPKATMIVAVRVVDHLRAVEEGLRDIMVGLGLAEPPSKGSS